MENFKLKSKFSRKKEENASSRPADDATSKFRVNSNLVPDPAKLGAANDGTRKNHHSSSTTAEVKSNLQNAEKAPAAIKNGNNAVYYTADDLRMQRIPGLDYTISETFLSPAEFQSIFGMTRQEFDQLPQWKRSSIKRQNKLF